MNLLSKEVLIGAAALGGRCSRSKSCPKETYSYGIANRNSNH
jgi:hypothetical protein